MQRARRTRANFRVTGSFDMSRLQEATVTIERAPLEPLFHVRIWKRKRVFTLPLSDVAKSVVMKIIMAEVAEKKPKRRTRTVKRGILSLK